MERWFPIQTDRLLLREFVLADEADVHEFAGDPIVSRYTDWGPNTPDVTHEVVLSRLEQQQKWPREEINLAIELRDTGKVIGAIGLRISDYEHGIADFGYVLNREFWNQGLITEAAHAVVERAFFAYNLHRLIATCDSRNVGSIRVMEKIGMRREGYFRRDVYQKGEWRDSYLYAILDNDRLS